MSLAASYAAAVIAGQIPPASTPPSEEVMALEMVRLVERTTTDKFQEESLASEFNLRLR